VCGQAVESMNSEDQVDQVDSVDSVDQVDSVDSVDPAYVTIPGSSCRPRAVILCAVLAIASIASPAVRAEDVAQMIAAGKPGAVVKLPAGTHQVGAAIVVPPGVSVSGAGYDKTVFAFSGPGLTVKGSTGASITDLTIRGAARPGLAVVDSADVRVERVRVLACGVGISFSGVTGGRVANAVVAENQIGIVIAKCAKTAVVNSTAANNTNLSISMTGNRDCAAFSNVFAGSQLGIACGSNTNLALDYNLYVALFVGGLTGEPTRESLPAWQSLSECDRHSVELVLDNAASISERAIIEDSYGVDLSAAKVVIFEFVIPMGYAWDGKAPVEMRSGTSFWMGMFVDDNDKPGLDEQNAYPWPVTFAAFGNPDQGAMATLE